MELANRIRTARAAAGLSQRQLAARLGVTASAVAQWEGSLYAPTVANRVDLARVLGIDFASLVPEADGLQRSDTLTKLVQQAGLLPPRHQRALLALAAHFAERAVVSGRRLSDPPAPPAHPAPSTVRQRAATQTRSR